MKVLTLTQLACLALRPEGRLLSASTHMSVVIGDSKKCDVRDYGAKLDGKTDDTKALQDALDDCGAAGGGVVLVPGPLLMYSVTISKPGIELRIKDSLILGDRETFLENWSGSDVITIKAKATDTAITGGGVVDGRGQDWWGHIDEYRPITVAAKATQRLLIHDTTFLNPPSHALRLQADYVEISHSRVFAPPSNGVDEPSHNTDAYDVRGNYGYVHHSNFSNGDDDVAIHGNHTLVERAYFADGHGASIGGLCEEWVHNITIRTTWFHNTTNGCRIKTHQNCAGHVKDVRYEDLVMHGVKDVFTIDMYYGDPGTENTTTFKIKDVAFKRIAATGQFSDGSLMCHHESPCTGFVFEDIELNQPGDAWTCDEGEGDKCCKAIHGTVTNVRPGGKADGLANCLDHSG